MDTNEPFPRAPLCLVLSPPVLAFLSRVLASPCVLGLLGFPPESSCCDATPLCSSAALTALPPLLTRTSPRSWRPWDVGYSRRACFRGFPWERRKDHTEESSEPVSQRRSPHLITLYRMTSGRAMGLGLRRASCPRERVACRPRGTRTTAQPALAALASCTEGLRPGPCNTWEHPNGPGNTGSGHGEGM